MTISASQIQTWLDCNRKWSFIYQDHYPKTQNASAALGTETHRQIEEYYNAGTPLLFGSPDAQQATAANVAQAIMAFLPAPGPRLEMEGEFRWQFHAHEYLGFIDLQDPDTLTIYDHKTTSNFRYKKTEEDLQHDVQAQLYAARSIARWKTPKVNLQWTYGRTKGKAVAEPVVTVVTAEHAAQTMQVIDDVASEIDRHRGKRSLDLLPNPSMCEGYGGCPFRHICNLGPTERLAAVMSNASTTDSLLARLKAQQAAATPQPSTPVAPGQINPPEAAQALTPAQAEAANEAAKATEAPTPAPAPAEAPKRQRKAKEPAQAPAPNPGVTNSHPIGTLYVNCMPIGGAVVRFEDLLKEANAKIGATEFHKQDGSKYFVDDYRFVQFGQGPAVLTQAVTEVLKAWGHVDELVVYDASTPEASVLLNNLVCMAGRTVRGTR